jgi:hypothetical protein
VTPRSPAGCPKLAGGQLREVKGAGGASPANAPAALRAQEAKLANAWFRTVTEELFG